MICGAEERYEKVYICLIYMLIVAAVLSSCVGTNVKPETTDTDTAEQRTDTDENRDDSLIEELILIGNRYFLSVGLFEFQSGGTVSVDKLIPYIALCDMRDDMGYMRPPYSDYSQGMTCTIPREKLNERIEEIFDVTVDDSVSEYLTDDRQNYVIEPIVRGGILPAARCFSHSEKDDVTLAKFEVTYPKPGTGGAGSEKMIEYYSSVDEFELTLKIASDSVRILSCRLSDKTKGMTSEEDAEIVGEGDNYKTVLNKTDSLYTCYLYNDGGSYVYKVSSRETAPDVTACGDGIIKIERNDSGVLWSKFFDTDTGRLSAFYPNVLDLDGRTVVYFESFMYRTVIVRDIFDRSVLYKVIDSFGDPLADVENPIVSAKLSEDCTEVEITYVSADTCENVTEMFNINR